MKRTFLTILCALCLALGAMAQAKHKPSVLVVPDDEWCTHNGFMHEANDMGEVKLVPDYVKALQINKDLPHVIRLIRKLLSDRGQSSIDLLTASRSGNTVNTDIIVKVAWDVIKNGPKNSIRYSLQGVDAYTFQETGGGAVGIGEPSFSAEVEVLLEEAVQDRMDEFVATLQDYYDDLVENGRLVKVEVVIRDGAGIDFGKEYGGMGLDEIIENWIGEHAVNQSFESPGPMDNVYTFSPVRIPMFKANGMSQNTLGFVRELMRFLRAAPYNIPCKTEAHGLGHCNLIIGEQ